MTESESTAVRQRIRVLLAEQRYGVLATCSETGPHPTLIAFAITPDLRTLIFATPRATRKFAHLTQLSRASLLVDDRGDTVAAPHQVQAVSAYGLAGEVFGAEYDELRAILLARHPHLRAFISAPSCALMQINVERYALISHFQDVTEVQMSP